MQIANYKNDIIQLKQLPRDMYQKIYIESVNGQVTCIHCGVPMRLHLGIEREPHFLHPASDLSCIETVDAYLKKESSEKEEVAGFRLPTKRSIHSSQTATLEAVSTWTKPDTFTAIPPFCALEVEEEQEEQRQYNLDRPQWEAVTTTEGPLLVLAGAGSGKTRVLTARTAHMLTEKEVPSNRMLLVTFTAKAAKEMKDRMKGYSGLSSRSLQQLLIGTFHSIFYKMLTFHEPDKWQPNRLLKWEWQRDQLVRQAGRELHLDEKEFAYDQALAQIGLWKNTMLTPKDITPKDVWEERTSYLYKRYEELKGEESHYDFDDMLLGCYELLKKNKALLDKYQERFSYIAVDEFQDINKVQYEIIQMLARNKRNLCVVGDDDQSIYGFRGSNPSYILNFKKDYPEAKTVLLARNYRSDHAILALANNVICHNEQRNEKKLISLKDCGQLPVMFYPFDEEEEATMIIHDIKERVEQGASPHDFAVLYRTNVAARALFERFVQSSLPFSIETEGESFYKRKTVKKLLAYLRLSLHEDDTKAMSDLIGALFLKQSALQDLKAISILQDCTLVQALTKLPGLPPFQERKLKKIVPFFKKLHKLSPFDALTIIEKEMGMDDYLKKQGNEGNKLEKGSDDVRDLKVAAKSHPSIPSFLEHVEHMIAKTEELRKSDKYKQDRGVQLMTIHRAKGLEFPHVYIVGAVDGGIPHDYALDAWRDGDDAPMEEERRLMYVAITRAEQTLKVSVPSMRRGKKAHPSRFVREMGKRGR